LKQTTTNQIIEACKAKDRAAIKRLIEAIPQDKWDFWTGRDQTATVYLPPVTVCVWYQDGCGGINSYTKVLVQISIDDFDVGNLLLYQSMFTDKELKIPNFISI
jgi:hypothetical protein